jgi:hypothetical protein
LTGHPDNGMPVVMPKPPENKLTLEWVISTDGMALFFDKATWNVFQEAANRREQSAEHMILRAVVACLGQIMEDNMVLNRMLRPRPSGQIQHAPDVPDDIAADVQRVQALCLERGWMRARADGRLEISKTGENELFQHIAGPKS